MASDFLADNNLVSDQLKRSRKVTTANDESYQLSSTQGIPQNVAQTIATYSTTNSDVLEKEDCLLPYDSNIISRKYGRR